MTFSIHANELRTLGYTVVMDPSIVSKRVEINQDFMRTIHTLPEYKNVPETFPVHKSVFEPALGAFSALGVASSFHNPHVRQMRHLAYLAAVPIFQQLCGPDDRFECVIDRMMYRTPEKDTTGESWHRDLPPAPFGRVPGVTTFGGWLNTGLTSQRFICSPGDILETIPASSYVPPPENPPRKKAKKEDAEHGMRGVKNVGEQAEVEIPPGGILIFNETLAHRIASSKKKLVCRIFMGWRISQDEPWQVLNPKLFEQIQNQDVIPLKSGQKSVMRSELHYTMTNKLMIPILVPWSQRHFRDELLVDCERDGVTYRIVPEVFHSLRKLDLMYEDYTASELAILFPHRIQ